MKGGRRVWEVESLWILLKVRNNMFERKNGPLRTFFFFEEEEEEGGFIF